MFMFMAILIIAIAHHLFYKRSKLVFATSVYMFISQLINVYYPEFLNVGMNQQSYYALKKIASDSLCGLVVISVAVFMPSKKFITKALDGICALALANSLCIIIKSILGYQTSGILQNGSMDSTFLVIMYPIIIHRSVLINNKIIRTLIKAIPVIAILTTKSSVGLGGLVLGIIALNMFNKRIIIACAISAVLFGIGFLLFKDQLFDDTMRFIAWKWSMSYWVKHYGIMFGSGLGTYWGIGPFIQISTKQVVGYGYYVFLHNDWLQHLFETGLLGIVTAGAVYIKCLINNINEKNRWLFSSIVVYGGVAVFNMPARYMLTAVIGVMLLRLSLDHQEE